MIKKDVLEGKTTSELLKVDVSKEPLKKIDFGKEAENYIKEFKEEQKLIACKAMRDSYV